jgi:hypothetical protein
MPNTNRWASDDVIDADRRAGVPAVLEVALGTVLTNRATGTTGRVIAFTAGRRVILQDDAGKRHEFAPVDGFFEYDGTRVALRSPTATGDAPARLTASGSVQAPDTRARVARASRIWVEGIHDAELLERIWGDDLRAAATVVEPLHGAEDLVEAVRAFDPGPQRRLGILLDHLVEGSKESRIAAGVSSDHVLIAGHPYVDIWQAIKPAAIGIETWPTIPRDQPWKAAVVTALGFREESGVFWRRVLGAVTSYADVETPLINAVERLLDFVTIGEAH